MGHIHPPGPESPRVEVGTSNDPAAMIAQLFDEPNVTNTSWRQGRGVFTSSSTGTYHVGFYAYSAANRRELAVDDLLVVTAGSTSLDFYDLVVSTPSQVAFGGDIAIRNDLTVGGGAVLDVGSFGLTVEGTVINDGDLRQTRDVPNATLTSFLDIRDLAGTTTK